MAAASELVKRPNRTRRAFGEDDTLISILFRSPVRRVKYLAYTDDMMVSFQIVQEAPGALGTLGRFWVNGFLFWRYC